MVTLRRDVAAQANNRVFDRADGFQPMTDYDLFVERKRQQRTAYAETLYKDTAKDSVADSADNSAYSFFGFSTKHTEEPEVRKQEADAVYYADNSGALAADVKPAVTAQKLYRAKGEPRRKLSKNAKIFIAIYVLVALIVASIILAVNNISAPKAADASVVTDNMTATVAPMNLSDDANSETNWFDKILDGLSND